MRHSILVTKIAILALLGSFSLFGAAEFNGSNENLGCGSDAGLDNMSSMVLSVWVRPDSSGGLGQGRIVRKRNGFNQGWTLLILDTGGPVDALRFALTRSSAITSRNSADSLFTYDGAWHHVLVTTDMGTTGTNIKMYFDGVEVSYGADTDGSGTFDDSAQNLLIGEHGQGGSGGWFDGGMACMAIWNDKSSISDQGALTLAQRKCSMAFHIGELGHPTRFWSFFNGHTPATDITAPAAPDIARGGTGCSGDGEVAEQPFGW
jgi:hypothetical protein